MAGDLDRSSHVPMSMERQNCTLARKSSSLSSIYWCSKVVAVAEGYLGLVKDVKRECQTSFRGDTWHLPLDWFVDLIGSQLQIVSTKDVKFSPETKADGSWKGGRVTDRRDKTLHMAPWCRNYQWHQRIDSLDCPVFRFCEKSSSRAKFSQWTAKNESQLTNWVMKKLLDWK
jgi:hypothetical protein